MTWINYQTKYENKAISKKKKRPQRVQQSHLQRKTNKHSAVLQWNCPRLHRLTFQLQIMWQRDFSTTGKTSRNERQVPYDKKSSQIPQIKNVKTEKKQTQNELTADRLPIIRKAVSVESNKKAIRFTVSVAESGVLIGGDWMKR